MALAPKQHLEFVGVDMKNGWEVPPGYPQKMQGMTMMTKFDATNTGVACEAKDFPTG